MLQAYFDEQMRDIAVFNLFVDACQNARTSPACGLDDVLSLETLRFDETMR